MRVNILYSRVSLLQRILALCFFITNIVDAKNYHCDEIVGRVNNANLRLYIFVRLNVKLLKDKFSYEFFICPVIFCSLNHAEDACILEIFIGTSRRTPVFHRDAHGLN